MGSETVSMYCQTLSMASFTAAETSTSLPLCMFVANLPKNVGSELAIWAMMFVCTANVRLAGGVLLGTLAIRCAKRSSLVASAGWLLLLRILALVVKFERMVLTLGG